MNKKEIFFILVGLVLVAAAGLGIKVLFLDRQNQTSALQVDSFPKADVYVNGQKVGQTPYKNDKLTAGDYGMKLVVTTGISGTYLPWETKVKLTGGGLTYVSRDIGATDDLSGDQILWLSKLVSDKAAEVAVVSDPDGANVVVDRLDSGRASVLLSNLDPGDHEIVVSQAGYSDQVVHGKVIEGYRLNVAVKLGRIPEGAIATAPVPTPSVATPSAYVVISNTPTGFLNVRMAPDLTATIAGKVNPGEKYPIANEQTGWVLLRQASSSANLGWVSGQYVVKFK